MGGTPTSIEDRRRGVFSYEALRSRLTQGRFAREGMRDMLAPIIRLQPLTYEELLVLIEKLAQIHAGYFGYESNLDEGDLVNFLKNRVRPRGLFRHAPHAARSHRRFHQAVGHHVPEPRCHPQGPAQREGGADGGCTSLNTRDAPPPATTRLSPSSPSRNSRNPKRALHAGALVDDVYAVKTPGIHNELPPISHAQEMGGSSLSRCRAFADSS